MYTMYMIIVFVCVTGTLRMRSRVKNARINILVVRINPKMMRSSLVMDVVLIELVLVCVVVGLKKRKLHRYPGIIKSSIATINFPSSTISIGITQNQT